MVSETRRKKDEERKARTRRLLLDAAARVFAQNGYHAPRIADIVAEANVGQGTFYRNFTDKRDIFETLFDEFQADLVNEFTDMSAHLPSSVEEYRRASASASRRMAAKIVEKRELALVFAREAPTIDHRFAEKWSDLQERFAQLARFFLEHATSNGFARPCDTNLVSRAIIGSAMYMSQLYLAGQIEDDPDKLIDELIDFAFSGIGPA